MDWSMFSLYLTLALLAAEFGKGTAQRVVCPSSTTLATFNTALVTFFAETGVDPEIEERTQILIQQVSRLLASYS